MTFDLWSDCFEKLALLSDLTPGWPQLIPTWPLTPEVHCIWSKVLTSKFGCPRALLSNLTSGGPLHDLWPQKCIIFQSGVLPTKFGGHWAFLEQFDCWMTFELWWGHFEKLTTNLGSLFPTTLPIFSSMCWSTTKRITGHTNKHTNLEFFSID